MKALVCDRFGSIDDVRYRDIDDPFFSPDDILIAVRAAGVGFYDVLFAEGRYQIRPEPPFILGSEVAGEVIALGANVTHWKLGDRIMSMAINFGSFAEKMSLPAWLPTRLPQAMSFEQGGTFMGPFGTAQHALRQRAALQPGETLLVTGAAGGTGSAALQVGRAIGARVIAVCSSDERVAHCLSHGAQHAINYSRQDLRQAVHELTGGRGVDVVFETVGGNLFDTCARVMAVEGRLLVVGFASGRIPELAANLPLVKSFSVVGVNWLTFVKQQSSQHHVNMQELLAWLEKGQFAPTTSVTRPLAEGVEALRQIARREVLGKIALKP